jgi:hypothetical protein
LVRCLAWLFPHRPNIDDRDGRNVEMVLFAGACYFVLWVNRVEPR